MEFKVYWTYEPIGHNDGPWHWHAIVSGHWVDLIEFED